MNIDQERINFEQFMSDDGKFPQAVERDSDGNYVLMQAASSWHVWQARARQDSAANVTELVEALEDISGTHHHSASAGEYFAKVARKALATHRKGGEA